MAPNPAASRVDDQAMDTATHTERCARCDAQAIARLDGDWLCADHALIGLADRLRVAR
jgi:hypothetical protein